MKKLFYVFAAGSFFFGLVLFASAVSIFDITYPIAELNGCASQQECKVYCDDLAHKDACLTFAEKYGFIAKEKIEQAKKIPKIGPGGCQSQKECRAYCDDPAHQDECLAFAEKYSLMDKNRIKAAKKIAEQGGPGGCKTEKECRAYCEDSKHVDECIAFAKQNSLVGENEMKMMEQGRDMMEKVREQGGPGGCKGPEECRAYCENPEHVEECLAFAVEHGGMDREKAIGMLENFAQAGLPAQAEGADDNFGRMKNMMQGMMSPPMGGFATSSDEHLQKFERFMELEGQFRKPLEMMQNFQGPGGCKGSEECIKYCFDPAHRAECAKLNPSAGGLPPGEIFRQIASSTERDFLRSGAATTSFGARQPFGERELKESVLPAGADSSACPREYHPVCGANNRTYPNECFAKKDNISVAKEGPCEAMLPPAGYPTDGYRPPVNQYPQQYTQPPVDQQSPAPQSRRVTDSLLSNLLQAFSRALILK